MNPEEPKRQVNRPLVGCSLMFLGVGALGVLFCILAVMYSGSFGNYQSIEDWIFKAGFVFFVMLGAGVIGLSFCGIDVNKLSKH